MIKGVRQHLKPRIIRGFLDGSVELSVDERKHLAHCPACIQAMKICIATAADPNLPDISDDERVA